MRFHLILAAAAVLCGSAVAHADDFTFSLTGTAGAFSGTGTFSGTESSTPGTYTITGISGSNTNGIIGLGGFGPNDNLLTPNGQYFVDTNGISFYDQTAVGVYAVRLFQSAGTCKNSDGSAAAYCVAVQEVNTSNPQDPTTLPVTFPGGDSGAARVAVRFSLARVTTPVSVASTPEPGSLMLLGSGALALAGFGRRRFLQR
jgi:hypothetical protein